MKSRIAALALMAGAVAFTPEAHAQLSLGIGDFGVNIGGNANYYSGYSYPSYYGYTGYSYPSYSYGYSSPGYYTSNYSYSYPSYSYSYPSYGYSYPSYSYGGYWY